MPFCAGIGPRIYYEVRGQRERPPLVMLRGIGRMLENWGGLDEELEDCFRLVLIDSRGAGRSAVPWLPFSIGDMAADVARVLDDAGVARAHFFGLSLGGVVAQEVAIQQPHRVDRLVLGCTTPGGREAEPARFSALAALARSDAAGRGAALQMLALMRHSTADELHRITAPTLIISSAHDALMPPVNSRILCRGIRGAELEWLSGDAHDFVSERPRQIARIITAFLMNTPAARHA